MKQPKVYICGPIKGYDYQERYRSFEEVEKQLSSLGFEAVNPMKNGLQFDAAEEQHMRKDILLLIDCDFMVQLDGHERSVNCNTEAAVALSCGIPTLDRKQLRNVSKLFRNNP